MRNHVREFVAVAVEAFDLGGPVYEFGSYLVEEQQGRGDLRHLFADREFIGCDLRPGPGVDQIQDLAQLSLDDGVAQTVICVDTLEHVFEARRAVEEMIRILTPGGILLIAAPMDFPVHQYPDDYWRLTPTCLERLLEPLAATIIGSQGVETYPHTVYAIGCKGPISTEFIQGSGRFIEAFPLRLKRLAGEIRWQRRLKRLLTGWARGKGERRRWRDYYLARFIVQMRVQPSVAPGVVRQQLGSPRRSSHIDLP